MIIEPATLTDVQRVWELICILEDTALPFEEFERIYCEQLESDRYRCLLAREAAGAPVTGLINLRLEWQLHHAARVANIMELVVDPAGRNAGVGHALFQAGCTAAREAGCAQVELETSCWREGAHRFYEREGMTFDHRSYTMKL